MQFRDEDRGAWSAAGGVVMAVCIGLATVVFPQPAVWFFVLGALIGLYGMVAPLVRARPFHSKAVETPPGGSIRAGGSIEAGGRITATGDIHAGLSRESTADADRALLERLVPLVDEATFLTARISPPGGFDREAFRTEVRRWTARVAAALRGHPLYERQFASDAPHHPGEQLSMDRQASIDMEHRFKMLETIVASVMRRNS